MNITNTHKIYERDKHIVFSCQYHVIWTTKYRRSVLDPIMQDELKHIIKSIQGKFKFKLIEIEVMEDHVHILISNSPKVSIYETVTKIKGFSSRKMREIFPSLTKKLPCLWTRARFISSVGSVSLETVKKYIENQKGK